MGNPSCMVINEMTRPVTREIRKFDFENVPPIHLGLQRGPFAVAWNQKTNMDAVLAETLWTKTPERRSWNTENPTTERIDLRKKPDKPNFDFESIRNDLSKIQFQSRRNRIGKMKFQFQLIRTGILLGKSGSGFLKPHSGRPLTI